MYKLIRNTVFTLFAALVFYNQVYAQEFEPYQWKEHRSLTALNEVEKEYGLYYLKIFVKYQYVYDPADNAYVCYVTNHYIIRTNNNEALSKSNRVYIPMKNAVDLIEVKARAITRDNDVINFDKVNLKELESDEAGYRILAIEGAEVGGEIEYYYTRKLNASNFITRTFQFDFPVKSYDFSLKCPENIEYEFKVYNWEGVITQTDTTEDFNQYEFNTTNIPAMYSEDFAAVEEGKSRLEFKLTYNTKRDNSRLFTWGDAGKRIYDNIYTLSKEEQKAVKKLIKDIEIEGVPIVDLKKAEHYIKTNYFIEEQSGDVGEQIDQILKNKYATSRGFTRIYAAILNELNIDHEIVLTSNRFEKAFDPDFDSWNYLGEYFIYINETKQFLSPKNTPFRLGTIPYGYYGTDGLFVRMEPVQNFEYPVAHISYIPESPYQDNFDNMDIKVSFSDDMEQNTINLIRSFKGYGADYYKAGLIGLKAEEKKEMLDDIIKYLALDAEIEQIDVVEGNTEYNNWDKPMVVKGSFTSNSYIELAGDVILFKAGELIGPQSELYQEKERKLPVVNSYNRGYSRKINVQIPKGYNIQNPDDLIMKEQVFDDNEKLIYNFVSNYVLNGQTLEIAIEEYYDELNYPVEKFEAFRKVINSAADFNKIVLVLAQ